MADHSVRLSRPLLCRFCAATQARCDANADQRGQPCCAGCTHWWAAKVTDPGFPLWWRVTAYAEAYAEFSGVCSLEPEELHHALDASLTKPAVSRAIATAKAMGLLHEQSSARCLVLARLVPKP